MEVYVRLREPRSNQDPDIFEETDQDGIHFYIDTGLDLPETITLEKARFVSDLPDHEIRIKEY